MISDLIMIFRWWLTIFCLGSLVLVLTRKIFQSFFDQGYLFGKVLGMAIFSYLTWLFSVLKILPFYTETIWLILVLALFGNLWFFLKNNLKIEFNARTFRIFFAEELIFFACLFFWSFIRGFQPDIQGLEKFMDYGFINSILRSKFFPPADMWFAGKSINYYYYGHYVAAFLTKLSGIPSAVTYNLMLGTIFAFTFSLTFSLVANLLSYYLKSAEVSLKTALVNLPKAVIVGGLISAILLSLGGNLHTVIHVAKSGSSRYWYPDATRYIGYNPETKDKTIHEFPLYSFVVSDLHGHVNDIPFVLFFLALSFNLFLHLKSQKLKLLSFSFLTRSLPISLILAIMFMTNQWDFPIYILVFGATLFLFHLLNNYQLTDILLRCLRIGLSVTLPAVILFIPFMFGFTQIAKGIGLVRAHSPFYQLLVLWGFPWFTGLTFFVYVFGRPLAKKLNRELLVKKIAELLGAAVKILPKKSDLQETFKITDIYVLGLFAVATLLVFIPEVIYVKDIYIPEYHRANTVFKLVYQSFIMYYVAAGYIITRVLASLKFNLNRFFLGVLYLLLFSSVMMYPFFAINSYYGGLKDYQGLFGLKFMERLYPDDYRAILWLNSNVKGQPTILEAAGDSYTDYERISMATGLPTVEGWLVHEWLWRGSYDEPGKRATQVQQIYEAKEPSVAKDLLDQYKVRYVIVGEMERKKYPNLETEKFSQLGKIVFQEGSTAIYQLN